MLLLRYTPSAMVHVVGTDDGAGEFLEQVALLVGAARGVDEAHGVGSGLRLDLPQAIGRITEGLFPGDFLQRAVLAEQRGEEAIGGAGDLVDVPASHADPALVGRDGTCWGRRR